MSPDSRRGCAHNKIQIRSLIIHIMKKLVCFATIMSVGLGAMAEKDTLRVKFVDVVGPKTMSAVMLTTEKDANDKAYDQNDLLWDMPMDLNKWKNTGKRLDETAEGSFTVQGKGLYHLGFTIDNNRYQKVEILVKAKGRKELFLDGKKQEGIASLIAGRHDCVLKLQEKDDATDTIEIRVVANKDSLWTAHFSGIEVNADRKRYYVLTDHTTGKRLYRPRISADGRFVMENTYTTRTNGQTEWTSSIVDLQTGNRYQPSNFVQWAAKGGRYISKRTDEKNQTVYEYRDVISGATEHLFTHTTQEGIDFVANDTKVMVYQTAEGPKEKNDKIHQILKPDDRLPGWRNRSGFSIIDVATGERRQITTGLRNTSGVMSADGQWLYIALHEDNIEQRPYYFQTGMLMNMESGQVDTLFQKDGFVRGAQFSPDASCLLFTGTPEAFARVGNVCPEGMVPNNYEYELFLMDLASKKIQPLTRDFDPNVMSVQWSQQDNCIYALCEDKDEVGVFRLDINDSKKGLRWEKLQLKEPYINGMFDLAKEKPIMVYSGMSAETTDHSWVMDLKKNKHSSLTDLNPTRLKDIQVGKCYDWSYLTERGDSVKGCYFLPPYFDETKKYPMLVYYYGGVTPVGKVLESSYNFQAWASMGYVVYLLQPSGCTGFGQEFAARHSNAWGDYAADDIIEGTKRFAKEHPFVNEEKIGCLGASYGGFMTQYLQTRTDIFAAAMSHAGISSQASYWGEGNWGYTYSAAASPYSYPWNNVKLYTEHSPLFNADKINTPILFMHGTVDNNVPMGESIQMFNALKILGKETAFIMVEGENHIITDFHKRSRWHDSIMAWFQKWLQDDDSWWNDMYPEKDL